MNQTAAHQPVTRQTVTRRLPTWMLALIVPVVAGAAVLVTVLTSGDEASAPVASRAAVTIEDFTFAPDPIEVRAGDTVRIANVDGVEHTLSADDGAFDSGIIERSGSASIVAPDAGTYTFTCQIHASMTGTLVAS